jgi:hypothetical protein
VTVAVERKRIGGAATSDAPRLPRTGPARRAAALLLTLSALLITGCVQVPEITLTAEPPARGALVSVEAARGVPRWLSRLALWGGRLPGPTPLSCGARLWRLVYWTEDHAGHLVQASGLYAEPSCVPPRALLSYQHGTVSSRDEVPSAPSQEGLAAAVVFAGAGYLTVAADYLGMGRSTGVQPYLHVESTVHATRDLLIAARTLARTRGTPWPEPLLLTGFSQGGHATAALHRALEAQPLEGSRLIASAIGSAPFDLAGISLPVALEGASTDHTEYLSYLTHGYSDVYGHPLGSLLAEPWATIVPGLLSGEHEDDELPRDPRALFTTDFLDAYDAGTRTWFLEALDENDTYRWAPRAPMRVYYGSLDQAVSPRDARFGVEEMRRRGGDVTLIEIGPLGHQDAALQAVPRIRAWFDALTAP